MSPNATNVTMVTNSTRVAEGGTHFPPILIALGYITFMTSLVIAICQSFAIGILYKCKRIPLNVKILSISFVTSELVGAVVFVVHQFIIYSLDINNDITQTSRTIFVGMLLTVSWASVASLTIERLVALNMSLKYNRSKHHLYTILIVVLTWCVHIIVIVTLSIVLLKSQCNWDLNAGHLFAASKPVRLLMMGFLILYEMIIAIGYRFIYVIVKRHVIQINAMQRLTTTTYFAKDTDISRRQLSATKAISTILLAFIILHLPICLHLIIIETDFLAHAERFANFWHVFSYVCIQINSCVSLSLYVGKFEEFKMHFYLFLALINSKYKKTAENLRIQVFNIVVTDENILNVRRKHSEARRVARSDTVESGL